MKPPQTDQKYGAAVLDLGNIAELSVPLIAEEYWVRQASVGLVLCADPPKVSGDPANLPAPAPCLARAFAGRNAPVVVQSAPVRHTNGTSISDSSSGRLAQYPSIQLLSVPPKCAEVLRLMPLVDETDSRRAVTRIGQTSGQRRRPRRNFTILRHAIDSANSAEKALDHH
jgi:hypothetical protein